ncbi:hypothetical protein DVH24_010453 [Malus domestica]|uniref:Uncharacterized protein n=1 Tax=Malus domestica TaxID=3750 RepID=A0A498JQS7_MALDO|nr:hypothetical protein DVH24_010453 [Malus domestica]
MKRAIYVEEELQEVPNEYQDIFPDAVAAGLQQPQVHHDLPLLELSWSWVGHGSSSPAWADKKV